MTATEPALETTAPDVSALQEQFRSIVIPAAAKFLQEEISANELRDLWRPYYFETFHAYDLTVEHSWRVASGSDGVMEESYPTADPAHVAPLSHFPVSIAHNNLDRLIEVMAVELGENTIGATKLRERRIDFAHMIDHLDELMAFLAG
jgi:hypothetical protein